MAEAAIKSTDNRRAAGHLGIGMHSYGEQWKLAKETPERARFHDALTFLEYAHSLGAGGVQVAIGARDGDYTKRLRSRTESLGVYVEGQASLPRDENDVARFEAEARAAKDSGATVMRTAMLSGRRYETFDSAEAFKRFATQSWKSLTLAEPVLKKHKLRLAIENHKDWLVEELLGQLRGISSEHIGVCVDVGNSIALLEDPMEVVEAFAPFAVSTHIKDMAVSECAEGFLLSEVSLGDGFLDLRAMIATLRRASPQVGFNLEMITRDPLTVPCLTQKYWATFADAPASRLARALGAVRQHASKNPLPRVAGLSAPERLQAEDDNVRQCLNFAARELGL